jgi:hypothetical protein
MAASGHAWYFTKSDLMKPLREGGTVWEEAVERRQKMFIFITTLGPKLQLCVISGRPIFVRDWAITRQPLMKAQMQPYSPANPCFAKS